MVAELIKIGKIKVQLNIYETQIKNLCVNEPEYLKKLLDNPASALLRVCIDVKNVPILVKVSTNDYTYVGDILINFFVGAGSYSDVSHQELPDLIPGPLQETNGEYVRETYGIESKATKSILFEGYGLKEKHLISPKEASKISVEERAIRDEKSGKTLLKSDGFNSAFLSYLDTVEFELGQREELKEFGMSVSLIEKEVDFDHLHPSFDSALIVEWKYIHELFSNSEVWCHGLDLDQRREKIDGYDEKLFYINCSFSMEIGDKSPEKIRIYTGRIGLFKLNDSGKGLVLDRYDNENSYKSCSARTNLDISTKSIEILERFVDQYAHE